MMKYFFNLLAFSLSSIACFGQNGAHKYLYCVNDSFALSIEAVSSDNSFHYYVNDDMFAIYGITKYSYWLNNGFLIYSKLERPHLHNRIFLQNGVQPIVLHGDNSFQKNEIAFYNWYGDIGKGQGDVFIIKQNGNYFYDYYLTHHIIQEIQDKVRMLNIDSTYKDYRMYNFEISDYKYLKKIDEIPYLYLKFCPKMGVVLYDFLILHIKIELQYIDDIPIDYYIKNNICLTPFCEIE